MKSALSECQVFIYTSCLKVGVDIFFRKFHSVYLLLKTVNGNHILNISDACQLIGRIRSYNYLHIYITATSSYHQEGTTQSDYLFSMLNKKYSINNETREFLERHLNIEQNLRKLQVLYMTCLLRMLYVTLKDPIFYYKRNPIEISALVPCLKKKSKNIRQVFLRIVTKSKLFDGHIPAFCDNIKKTVLKRISKYTSLSFSTFYNYIKDYNGLADKDFYKQFLSIATMLSTPTGILKTCVFLNARAITCWSEYYHVPYPSSRLEELDLDFKCDLRLNKDDSQTNRNWIDLILTFLYNEFIGLQENQLYNQEMLTGIKVWNSLQKDLKSVWKCIDNPKQCLEQTYASPYRLYKIFINENVPPFLTKFDVYREVMKYLFSVNIIIRKHPICKTEILQNISTDQEFEYFDVNKFMVFMVS